MPVREVFADGKVRSWASILDDKTREQAARTAELPVINEPIALMPDAHLGAGATIGSVIVTDRAVIPMAVGVDIGCGMAAMRTHLHADFVPDDVAKRWVQAAHRLIPAGLGKWFRDPSEAALAWLEKNAPPGMVLDKKTAAQLGTLGSGNHFVELALDEVQGVWILLHSGSRGAGNLLARAHAEVAERMTGELAPERDLAWLVGGTAEFDNYIYALNWAQGYAMKNRELLLDGARRALEEATGDEVLQSDIVNCHHNYAAYEYVEEVGDYRFVTRKGAISAAKGVRGLIPGAMGQASFVVEGLGNAASYESCAHGAGRLMSRTQARKTLQRSTFETQMKGVAWQDNHAQALIDEAPQAYKDVETVMADQADLVKVLYRLRAIANYKGVEKRRRKK